MQPKIETLEQIAERLAPPHSEVCRSHTSGACDCWRTRQRIAILAALREVEARAKYEYGAEIANQSTIHVQMLESENAGFGILGALDLPSEKAEAEVERLRAIVKARNCAEKAEAENARLREAIQRYVMVAAAHECDSDDPDKCSPDDDIWRESDTGNLRHGYGEDVSDCESVTLWEAVNAGHVTVPTFTPCVHHWYGGACEQCAEPTEEPSETKEQIAERLTIGATLRTPYEQEALILAALREVEAAAHCLRSTSQIISAEQRAEKAEAEVERLRDVLHAIAFDAGSLLAARNLALRALAAPAEGPKL